MTLRYKSTVTFLEYPVIAISVGPDPTNNETRGHARGVIAVGDIATGVLAFGGVARGLIAVGGVAVGGLTIGGVGLGLVAFGGLALGYFALGGLVIGHAAVGGLAIGHFVIGPMRPDPRKQSSSCPGLRAEDCKILRAERAAKIEALGRGGVRRFD
jgi:hypothetical protein